MTDARSFGARLTELATIRRDQPAVTLLEAGGGERTLSWTELDRRSNQAARLFEAKGAGVGAWVAVQLPNSLEHYVATFGAWKAGAAVLPLSAALPPRERDALVALLERPVLVSAAAPAPFPTVDRTELGDLTAWSAEPVPDRVPDPGKAIASGGSTGRPKVIVTPGRWERVPGAFPSGLGGHVGFRPNQIHLVAGPLYHNLGFFWGAIGLFEGHRLIVLEKFDASRYLDAVERFRPQFSFLVPTTMSRIAALERARATDWSSIEAVVHSAAPCPASVKRAWIDLVGPTRLYEAFGASEAVGITVIRGDEWLVRPGSVGRPLASEVRILDETQAPVPTGQVGEIFMRSTAGPEAPYRYLGAGSTTRGPDGFESVGDLGYLDAAGYLFPVDRRTDLIITGGSNVYPAEVEAALAEHPLVRDAAVIGLSDPEWGRRVHAIVELDPGAVPDEAALAAHCRERLAPYKTPKTWEFVDRLPRDPSGKLSRSALVAARSQPSPTLP